MPVYFFFIAFAVSWLFAAIIVVSATHHNGHLTKTDGLMMFPLMLLGPFFSGIICTRISKGKKGNGELFQKMTRWKVSFKWYLFLFIPPLVIGTVLSALNLISPGKFAINNFFVGFLFGIPAGFLEETGWTGFAFSNLRARYGFAPVAIFLGIIWGLWHLPVIDFLGAAFPHGAYLVPFMLAFIVAMSAIRVFICRIYEKTGSILLAQLFHIFSTGSLVTFGPANISAANEVLWYLTYGLILWLVIVIFKKWLLSDSRLPAVNSRQTTAVGSSD